MSSSYLRFRKWCFLCIDHRTNKRRGTSSENGERPTTIARPEETILRTIGGNATQHHSTHTLCLFLPWKALSFGSVAERRARTLAGDRYSDLQASRLYRIAAHGVAEVTVSTCS
uniref:Uncharacterized protein n=1 Tax=Pseudo-nitzschia australis TaxID=44445 RepID=A0A7S4EMS9_9STRA|mmetsp:Transcript_20995/g.45747  ORF Transcript_20995/g.45747 Transcript_20995/m.45747 type:complete len:114 (+) Transcript_20995:599-940(+)